MLQRTAWLGAAVLAMFAPPGQGGVGPNVRNGPPQVVEVFRRNSDTRSLGGSGLPCGLAIGVGLGRWGLRNAT